MTFQEMFDRAKAALTKASAADSAVFVAAQVNVTGEGSGIFYVKAADGVLEVEPYDYMDHNVLLTADSAELLAALEAAKAAELAMEGGAKALLHSRQFWAHCRLRLQRKHRRRLPLRLKQKQRLRLQNRLLKRLHRRLLL